MPYCPNPDCSDLRVTGQHGELVSGVTHCPTCGATLVESQPVSEPASNLLGIPRPPTVGRRFKVYHHPEWGYEAVKIGVSWPAFFFGPLWILVKKLWVVASVWFVFYVLLGLVSAVTEEVQAESGLQRIMDLPVFAAYVVLALLPVFWGNAWRSRKLDRRGYTLIETVKARSAQEAVSRIARV